MVDEKENREDQSEEYGVGGVIWELVKMVFWVVVIIVPLRMFLIQPFFVQGASMEPNFEDREYLIINELGYKTTKVGLTYGEKEISFFTMKSFKELKRGDVVVFRYPKNPSIYYIKRIVGLPGEKIEIKDKKVKVSNFENPEGFVLDESKYLSPSEETSGDQVVQLSESEYFVLGDNRSASSDSRSWGPLPEEDVVGKVLLRAWPFRRATLF
jgi:signal peptidase I